MSLVVKNVLFGRTNQKIVKELISIKRVCLHLDYTSNNLPKNQNLINLAIHIYWERGGERKLRFIRILSRVT